MIGLLVGLVLPATPVQETNRRWTAELEVRGAVERVELDFGAAGRTHVELGRREGETGTVRVAVPVRAPLGRGSLDGMPTPGIQSQPPVEDGREGPAGTGVGWRGFTAVQPPSPGPSFRARPVPALGAGRRVARAHELAVVLFACVAVIGVGCRTGSGLRRARFLALLVGGAGALAVGGLASVASSEVEAVHRVLEVDGQTGHAWWVRAEAGTLFVSAADADRARVEVESEGAELRIEQTAAGEAYTTSDPRARLVLRRPAPPMSPWSLGEPAPLPGVGAGWMRDPDGTWRALERWPAEPRGAGDPDPEAESGPGPPGWLSAGLPPGRRVRVATLDAADPPAWLRVVGIGD